MLLVRLLAAQMQEIAHKDLERKRRKCWLAMAPLCATRLQIGEQHAEHALPRLAQQAGGQHHHRTNFDKYHLGYFGKGQSRTGNSSLETVSDVRIALQSV